MDKLSICFFSHSSMLGGAERSLLDMIIQLKHLGAECSIVMGGEGELTTACIDRGIKVKTVTNMAWWCSKEGNHEGVFQNLSYAIKNCLNEMITFAKSVSADVIYTQTVVNPFGAMVAEALNLPHIWALREYGELDHGLKFALGYRQSMDMLSKASDRIFSITLFVADIVLNKERNTEKIKVNYSNIIIPDNFRAQNISIFQNTSVKIGIFGGVTEGKNQKDIVLACLDLLEKNYQIELYIVGSADTRYLEELNNILKNSKYQSNFIFTDYIPDPIPLMNKMDIIVSCSRSEALGRTILEATLLKKPIIYPNTGGINEVFTTGEHGLSYRLYNIKDLVDKIIDTIENTQKTFERVKKAFEYVTTKFTTSSYANPVFYAAKQLKETHVDKKQKYVTEFVLHEIACRYVKTVKLIELIGKQETQLFSRDQEIKKLIKSNQELMELANSMRLKNRIKKLLFFRKK